MSYPFDRPIALVGLMGAGKSAVAHRLGERFGVAVADLDDLLEAEEGRTIADLMGSEGEPAFRAHEGRILRSALASGARILSCGGGVVLDPAHRALLHERCRVVWLEVSPAEAARRLASDSRVRPLLKGAPPESRLLALLEARTPFYEGVAEARVATDGREPDAVADEVVAALEAGIR